MFRAAQQALGLAEHELFVPQSSTGRRGAGRLYEAYADLHGNGSSLQSSRCVSMASGAAFHRAYPGGDAAGFSGSDMNLPSSNSRLVSALRYDYVPRNIIVGNAVGTRLVGEGFAHDLPEKLRSSG